MTDRWLYADTDDFSDLPVPDPPTGIAPMRPAQQLPNGDTPPNLHDWNQPRREHPNLHALLDTMAREDRRRGGRRWPQ